MNILDSADMLAIKVMNEANLLLAAGESEGAAGTATWSVTNITGAQGNSFSSVTNAVQDTGNGLVYIFMMIIGFAGVIGLGIAVLKIMLGDSATKSQAKGALFWILVAAIVGFGAIGIIGMTQTIGQNLFTAANAVSP